MSLATACHPASRNPATTGTQESVCSFCGQLHIFSPPRKKKKAATKVRPLPHPPSSHEGGPRAEGDTPALAGHGGRLVPMGGSHAAFSSSASRKRSSCKRHPQHCRRIVLSLQEEEKPRTNLTWFSPHGDCSSIQGCHSHTTH